MFNAKDLVLQIGSFCTLLQLLILSQVGKQQKGQLDDTASQALSPCRVNSVVTISRPVQPAENVLFDFSPPRTQH